MSRYVGPLQTPQLRKIFTVPFTANTTERVYSPDIPRQLISKLVFRLAGTLTKTQACAGTLSDTVFSLIRGIRFKADGEVIKDIAPTRLRTLSHHIFRGQDTNSTHITLGSDTAEAFSGRLEMDFQSPLMSSARASYFPGHRYDQLEIEVDWADYTQLVYGGVYSAVSYPTAPTLEIWAEIITDPSMRNLEFLLHKYTQKIFSVNAVAQTAAPFQLPVGEAYRGILISQFKYNPDLMQTSLVASTANVQIRVDGTHFPFQMTWAEIIQRNQAHYGIALPNGDAFIDFCEDGDFRRALRTSRDMTLEALVDTSSLASAFLQFTPITYKAAPRAIGK